MNSGRLSSSIYQILVFDNANLSNVRVGQPDKQGTSITNLSRKISPARSFRATGHDLKARGDYHRVMHVLHERTGLKLELHAMAC